MTKIRGFEVAKGFEDKGINLPERSTAKSAGYDFEVAESVTVEPGSIKLVPTGIKAYMADDEVLKIFVRSSAPKKVGVILANGTGIIDSDYYNNPDNDGHIMFQVLNITQEPITIAKGTKIGQGIFEKFLLADGDQAEGERIGGFGSTTRV